MRCSANVIAASTTSPASATNNTIATRRPRSERIVSAVPRAQRVADAAHRLDQRLVAGVDLLAQVADVGLEHAGVAVEVVLPDVVEDLLARQHAARIEHEVVEQAVLGGRQFDVAVRRG